MGYSPWDRKELDMTKQLNKNKNPGGPVVKAPHCQCWGCGFDPWLGKEDPTCIQKIFFKVLKKE